MQAQNTEEVYSEIKAHIDKQDGLCSDWYVGIASNWKERLFSDHSVPRKDHWFIARQCHNNNDARAVESDLLKLGCEGGGGGGDNTTVYVYAYLKTSVTDP